MTTDQALRILAEIKLYYDVIDYPKYFTPNGDGVNDFWDIDYVEYYPDIIVMVYDRWGRQVFFSEGYSSDKRWDGRYNGTDVPPGTYYYIIDLKNGLEPYNGPVTIVR